MPDKLTLSDFAPPVVTVDVTTAYGRMLSVDLKLMSYHAYMECGLLIPDPKLRYTALDDSGKPKANYQDKDYLREMQEAFELRELVRLAKALTDAGMELAGATLVEQARGIRDQWDSSLVNSLGKFLRDASIGAVVSPHDDPFPGLSGGGAADNGATASDA